MKRFVVVAFLLSSCAGRPPLLAPPAPPAPAAQTDVTLFLIGDGGFPKNGGEPVLIALSDQIRSAPAETIVVFLGDNIYPAGLAPEGAEDREELERRLLDQIRAVGETGARAVFVPGNHDWANGGDGGLEAIRRQGEFIGRHSYDGRVVMLPENGCPGPEVFDLGERLRIIALDTQWWLHTRGKPDAEQCTPGTEPAVVDALRGHLASKGERHAVVVAHHPLLSSASHGGYFNWQDHLFPLTRGFGALWVPLPGIGSLYPLARKLGASPQDLSSGANRRMRAALEEAFRDSHPLAFAGGHEHTLEVLKGEVVPYLLVSGAGYYGHTSPTRWRPETLFQRAAPGFLRLDFLTSGEVRLGVMTVERSGAVEEPFAIELR